jgi:hypothetical protein
MSNKTPFTLKVVDVGFESMGREYHDIAMKAAGDMMPGTTLVPIREDRDVVGRRITIWRFQYEHAGQMFRLGTLFANTKHAHDAAKRHLADQVARNN